MSISSRLEKIQEMLDYLLEREELLSEGDLLWLERFSDHFDRTGNLSYKQETILQQIWERY